MRHSAALFAAILLILTQKPNLAEALCEDPSLDAPLVSQSVGGSALSPTASHPLLERTIVAAGRFVHVRELGSLAPIGAPLELSGAIENTPNPTRLNDDSYGAFVVQQDGVVTRIDPTGTSPSLVWQTDLRRTGCPEDSVSAAPVVQLRRYASASFRARHATDLVYVATRYDSDCANGNISNRVYALNAETGQPVWTFNEGGEYSVDAAFEAPGLDYAGDRILLGTDRTASATQDSLWSIDVLNGTRKWSSSVGQVYASPVLRGSRVYIASRYGEIKAVSIGDGATIWTVGNGGIPITSNIFREFRRPYGELISAVDFNGDIWLVRDDGTTASSVWTASLVDPVTGASTRASSRVANDPSSGKFYVGADDGQIYQLNMVDGSVEATRAVSAGSAVGGASFVFEGANVNMVAGAANGTLAKFCAPWAAEALMSPLTPNCTSDVQCDPENPNPTPCSTWACQSGVCVVRLEQDGLTCDGDGNPNTSGDVCDAGICLGTSDCQEAPNRCQCIDEAGTSIVRELRVSPTTCDLAPPMGSGIDVTTWCGQELVSATVQNDCLTHGTASHTAVWVHLLDETGHPFEINSGAGSVTMTISGGAGSPPVFLSPANMTPVSGTSASLGAGTVVASPNRVGTYYAYLASQDIGATPSGTTPWNVDVNVVLNDGGSCIDTAANSQVLSVPVTMGHVQSQACPMSAAQDSGGFVQVSVAEAGNVLAGAPVQIGYANNLRLAQSFEESILDAPTGASTALTNALGSTSFTDLGSTLRGAVVVSATCPGGEIGDAKTQTITAASSSVQFDLTCSPPGHVTYQVGDIFRVEARAGAVPENLSDRLDALSAGNGDQYPAVSRNGQWMTLITERFHPNCNGWSCVAIVNSDFTAVETPFVGGSTVHPEGRTAISNDGNTLVYFGDGVHQDDLYATQKSGGTWSNPLLLTADSPHQYNKQPVLSNDGLRVLFDCGPGPYAQENNGVCEVGIDGTGFQQIADPDNNPLGGGNNFSARHGDFAPDGSYVFEADWNAEQIWRLDSPLATAEQVFSAHSNDNSPCVLPNGNVASLWLGRPGNPAGLHEIKVTYADGSDFLVVTPDVDVADIGMSCHE